jgi:hypothetical protein
MDPVEPPRQVLAPRTWRGVFVFETTRIWSFVALMFIQQSGIEENSHF